MPPEAISRRLILFTRYPEPGKVKTRLIPAAGPAGAAALQRWMSERVLAAALALTAKMPVTLEIRYTGAVAALFQEWLRLPAAHLQPQGTGDLGARMERASREAFARGAAQVILLGADCPALTGEVLAEGFRRLVFSDLVAGPASDGGYYLLGMTRHVPEIFSNIPWGSGEVLAETLRRVSSSRLDVALLETLPDIDRPEDLRLISAYGFPQAVEGTWLES